MVFSLLYRRMREIQRARAVGGGFIQWGLRWRRSTLSSDGLPRYVKARTGGKAFCEWDFIWKKRIVKGVLCNSVSVSVTVRET